MKMLWVELIVLGFLLAGGVLVGRSMARRRREEEDTIRSNAEMEKVLSIVADLKHEVDRCRTRIEVLEALATDDERRVADEIERLNHKSGGKDSGKDPGQGSGSSAGPRPRD